MFFSLNLSLPLPFPLLFLPLFIIPVLPFHPFLFLRMSLSLDPQYFLLWLCTFWSDLYIILFLGLVLVLYSHVPIIAYSFSEVNAAVWKYYRSPCSSRGVKMTFTEGEATFGNFQLASDKGFENFSTCVIRSTIESSGKIATARRFHWAFLFLKGVSSVFFFTLSKAITFKFSATDTVSGRWTLWSLENVTSWIFFVLITLTRVEEKRDWCRNDCL